MTAAVTGEGREGTSPTKILKVIWDNGIKLERKFQSWWYPVNFTYDPTGSTAPAFMVTICNALVNDTHPIIAPGLNHDGAVLYPLEHRLQAQKDGNQWQRIDINTCIVQEQQGVICQSNTTKDQDICPDTEQNVCYFEIHLNENLETALVHIGKGCIFMRTSCNFLVVDNLTVDTINHSNIRTRSQDEILVFQLLFYPISFWDLTTL